MHMCIYVYTIHSFAICEQRSPCINTLQLEFVYIVLRSIDIGPDHAPQPKEPEASVEGN